ncbi:MAG TPA: RcpC/CpaB family pilus assembly protein [Jiangellales bacterium]|nr:RcpC/CpaB family pilus assembly protein [Jiangellales bacterium]
MTRRIIGVLLAIILAVLGTTAVLVYVKAAQNRVADGQRAVRVLIATQRIPAGTSGESIRGRGLVEEVVMPALSVPVDTLSVVPTELDGLVVTSDVQPRQLLLRGMFGAATKLSGGLNVPEKTMAVSVEIAINEQVGGYVRPGSQIAIFDTYDEPERQGKVTRVLLPRVEVLAVGQFGAGGVTSAQQNDGTAEGGDQQAGLVVTVAVGQADAERLIHADHTGELYFALLTDSSEVQPGPGVDNRTLFP